jgi:hypothetical protein
MVPLQNTAVEEVIRWWLTLSISGGAQRRPLYAVCCCYAVPLGPRARAEFLPQDGNSSAAAS